MPSKATEFATREDLAKAVIALSGCAVTSFGILKALNQDNRELSGARLGLLEERIDELLKAAKKLTEEVDSNG